MPLEYVERQKRAYYPASRLAIATAVATFAAFAAAAAFDWVWQIGVIPVVALLVAAVAVSGLRDRERIGPGEWLPVLRVVIVLAALVALWRIMVPAGQHR